MRTAILRKFLIISLTVYVGRYLKFCISVTNKMSMFLLLTIESTLIIHSLRKKYGLEPYNLSMKRENVYFKIFHRDFLRHLRSKKGNLKVLKKVLVAVDVYI